MDQHQMFMDRALALARQVEGQTSPNPAVGSLVVNDGQIVGEGFHVRSGADHAEVVALRAASSLCKGATLYVTLEPCNHHGRTAPCTEAIIKAGISEVFYAVSDSNPHVCGNGHERLERVGIVVHQGPCRDEAHYLNRFYFHFISTGQPHVIAKYAASLDGKIATHTGRSQWITGPAARQKGHALRNMVDAILVGAGTVVADNPRLTTRISGTEARHALRVVLDSRGRIPLEARVFSAELPGHTVVATTAAMSPAHQAALMGRGVEIMVLPETSSGRVDLSALLKSLGSRQLVSLLVEGGAEVLGAFFKQRLVNETWAFLAPLIIGGATAPGPVGGAGFATLPETSRLQNSTVESIGGDILIRGLIDNQERS